MGSGLSREEGEGTTSFERERASRAERGVVRMVKGGRRRVEWEGGRAGRGGGEVVAAFGGVEGG